MNTVNIAAELSYLQANYAVLPLREVQTRRGAAMAVATAIVNADPFCQADFDTAYPLLLDLDRVGRGAL